MRTTGVIAASEPHTAAAGAALLRQGGTAVDAIVAAKLAACVTEAPLTSLGGGGACVFGSAKAGYRVLDFFATTPGIGLTERPPLDFSPMTVDFGPTQQTYHLGKASVAVPGELVGLLALHRAGGRLPLRDVVAPAARLATEGFAVSPQIAMIIGMLGPIARTTPEVARAFFPIGEDRNPVPGDRLSNPALGALLTALGDGSPDAVVARYWADLAAHFGPTRGGMVTPADCAAYAPVFREPLQVRFGAHTVLTNPPPSAGGGLIGAGLRIAEGLGLGREPFQSAAHLQSVAAVLAAVSDIRASGYDDRLHTDPDAIRALVTGNGSAPWVQRARQLRDERSLGGTTHISVIDGEGFAASMTTSNGEGCGHALPGSGIHLNNFLGEEDINPGGFHQFTPGTRMSTMMSPTIVTMGDDPRFVLGTGGSNRIRSAVLQALLNLLAYQRPLDEAVNAARMHIEGRKLWFEDVDLAPGAGDILSASWPDAARFGSLSMFFGGVHSVATDGATVWGAGDRRRGGVVVAT
jgi:gamma-glutamyltranspeptidase/glutathione hydrolase